MGHVNVNARGGGSSATTVGVKRIGLGAAADVAAEGAHLAAGDGLDEAVEDDELELEFDAVDGGLEGALQVEQAGVLDPEQGHVEPDDEQVDVDEVVQHRLGPARLVPRRRRVDRRVRHVQEGRHLPQVLPRLPDVEDAEDRLLHEEDGRLQTVPDRVDV